MGKASKCFRGLFGLKKCDSATPSRAAKTPKRRWSFVKSYGEKGHHRHSPSTGSDHRRGSHGGSAPPPQSRSYAFSGDRAADPSRHAIAVATSARSAKLTSGGRYTPSGSANAAAYGTGAGFGIREEWAAVKIQSNFRAYLARRALRALKSLVKLQALARGHIVRKRTADMMRRMQSLFRAQARALKGRAQISGSSHSTTKSSHFHQHGPATPKKIEQAIQANSTKHDQSITLKRNVSKSNGKGVMDREKSILDCRRDEGSWEQRGCFTRTLSTGHENRDNILETDTRKPKHSQSLTTSKDSTIHQIAPILSHYEVQSLSPLKFTQNDEETPFCTAANSPQFYSASSKGGTSMRGPFTPKSDDGSRSYFSGYSDHPNYMAFTASSKAKMRSLSAPRQRTQSERPSVTKRYLGYGDPRQYEQRFSALRDNFTSKAYPGSGRLESLGMSLGNDATEFMGSHWRRY